ncbi:YrdB family protein [Deinococcus misasensis]|uniref:YrdB family protein n=1 Tax=Deinococcus misasensis TaxID=392413 RepID=UPI000552CA14|nr:YrdB family protein [Deinococcus misasensis]
MDFKSLNLALAFLIELVMLWAFGLWGFHVGSGPLMKWGLGLGLPVLVAVFWGVFMSPRAVYPLPDGLYLVLQVMLFGGAAVALMLSGKMTLGIVYAVLVVLNLTLALLWKQ